MAKAVGVGGIFLKAKDPKALSAWYATHLGIPAQDGGSLAFDGPETAGMTVFSHFPRDTGYFGEGGQEVDGELPGRRSGCAAGPVGGRGCAHRPKTRRFASGALPGSGTRRATGWNCGSHRQHFGLKTAASLDGVLRSKTPRGTFRSHTGPVLRMFCVCLAGLRGAYDKSQCQDARLRIRVLQRL